MERTGFELWKPKEVARLLALVETERRYYQEMVAALPIPLAVLSTDRSIVSANRSFRRIADLRIEDLRQRKIEQVFPSDELIERIRSAHVHGDTTPFLLTVGDRLFRIALVPIRSWEEDLEAETLLAAEDLTGIEPRLRAPGAAIAPIPGIFWEADAATLTFRDARGALEEMLGYPSSHWLNTPQF